MANKMSALKRFPALCALITTAALCPAVAPAHSPSYYASTSAMASGNWARIKVSGKGIHQITAQQLSEMGFNDPARVKVCGYGGTLLTNNRFSLNTPDDVKATPSVLTADGRILFYAVQDVNPVITGTDGSAFKIDINRNVYSLDAYYLLTDSESVTPADMSTATAPEHVITATSHWAVDIYEPEDQNPGEGGAVFHSVPYTCGDVTPMPFFIRDFDVAGKAYLGVHAAAREFTRYQYYSPTVTAPAQFSASLDEQIDISATSNSELLYNTADGGYTLTVNDQAAGLPDGEYTFSLNWPSAKALDYAALDYAWLVYPRRNVLDSATPGGLLMHFTGTSSRTAISVSGATDGAMIWNVTDPGHITVMPTVFSEEEGTVTTVTDRAYGTAMVGNQVSGCFIAFNTSDTHMPVEIMENVPNQNIHGDATPDMVIITTDALRDAAQQLAEIHRKHDGIDVNVYTQKEIFNEFSAATPCAMAYRRMIKMFHDRDSSKMKYVMLYGSGTWDNRGLIIKSPNERLIIYEVERTGNNLEYAYRHINLNFASDNYFGMLSDTFVPDDMHFTRVDVAVGRVPLDSPSEALALNKKIDDYLSNLPSVDVYSRILLLSDNGDRNEHLRQSEELATSMAAIQPALTFTRAHVSIYPLQSKSAAEARRVVTKNLIKGVGYFSFTGHGRPTYLTSEMIWSQNDVDKTSYTNPPLGVFSTCDTYELDRNTPGIAEQMVKRPGGGTIASVAAARSVYLEHNQYINKAMAETYASAQPGATVGEIYRNAHNKAVSYTTANSYAKMNTMCYNLCGDPAIRLAIPALKTQVTAVNGTSVTAQADENADPTEVTEDPFFDIKPMSLMKVSGTIVAQDGTTDTSFNGTANITLYDGAHVVPVIIHDASTSGDKAQDITLDENTLAATAVQVSNGQWEASILVPYPSFNADLNRLVVTATEDADPKVRRSAAGLFDRIRILEDTTDPFSGESLTIEEFYINSPEFNDGDVVPSAFNVYARIRLTDSGLSKNSGIGGAGKLILDGRQTLDGADGAIVINTDGTATLDMPVTQIEDGRHTLTLNVADASGNRVQATLAFTVINAETTGTLTLEKDLVRENALIDLSHNFSGQNTINTRLIIKDVHGNTVQSVENPVFPYTWNLTDKNQKPLPDGRYSISAVATNGNSYTATPAVPLTIIRK